MGVRSQNYIAARNWAIHARPHISEISVQFDSGNSHVISLPGRIKVIAGLNGGGKTTLLRAIGRALEPEIQSTPILAGFSRGSDMNQTPGATVTLNSDHSGRAAYIDPVDEYLPLVDNWSKDANFDDLIEGVDPAAINGDLLEVIKFLAGRDYTSIEVFEIAETSGSLESSEEDSDPANTDEETRPYFVLRAANISYNSFSAGRGELIALYLLWRLSRVAVGSLVLIEEPESGLAQRSQQRLLDCLLHIAKSRDAQIVMSSHSVESLHALPGEHVCIVDRAGHGGIIEDLSASQIWSMLGLESFPQLTIVVEDPIAALFLKCLLRAHDPSILDRVSLRVHTDGESALYKLSKQCRPFGSSKDLILCVADGDMRGKKNYIAAGMAFLPGDLAPEPMIKRGLETLLKHDGSDLSGVYAGMLAAQGTDMHDWIHTVSTYAGGIEPLIVLAIRGLEYDQEFGEQTILLLDEVRSILSRN